MKITFRQNFSLLFEDKRLKESVTKCSIIITSLLHSEGQSEDKIKFNNINLVLETKSDPTGCEGRNCEK